MPGLQVRMHAIFDAITDPFVLTDAQKNKNMLNVCEQATARHVKTFMPDVPVLNPSAPIEEQAIDVEALTVPQRCAITIDRIAVLFRVIGRQQKLAAKQAADAAADGTAVSEADAESGLGGT